MNAEERFEGRVRLALIIGWGVVVTGSLALKPWFPEWSSLLKFAGYGAFALFIVFLVARWRIMHGIRQRRVLRNQCHECGYSRDGLDADAVCPECSAKPSTLRSL